MMELQQLETYQPKTEFEFSKKGYTVKIADSPQLLEQTLRLRHDVFYREYIGHELESGIDFDEFDLSCDHLVILKEGETRPVGTYRFRCSTHVDTFYTQTEFDCDSFLQSGGVKAEMGRACIEKDSRNGTVMTLLFRGLAQYIRATETDFLFGCSSVRVEDTMTTARLLRSLQDRGAISQDWTVIPVPKYQMDGLADIDINSVEPLDEEKFDELLPGLLSAYVKAGSRFVGLPAHDRKFHCIDLFTVLSVENLMNLFRKRYLS